MPATTATFRSRERDNDTSPVEFSMDLVRYQQRSTDAASTVQQCGDSTRSEMQLVSGSHLVTDESRTNVRETDRIWEADTIPDETTQRRKKRGESSVRKQLLANLFIQERSLLENGRGVVPSTGWLGNDKDDWREDCRGK